MNASEVAKGFNEAPGNFNAEDAVPHLIIVGGGAGGLELATRLGDTLGKRGQARVTLVDRNATHVWKPFLHEIAAGSLDVHIHQLDYLAHAYWHHFRFQLGNVEKLDRAAQEIVIGATITEDGIEMLPRRTLRYDILVVAVGSTTHDFGVLGAAEHAIALDTPEQATRLHRLLIAACVRANTRSTPEQPAHVDVAIIGGGATGVELAAEMRSTTRMYAAYGLDNIDPPRDVRLAIIEAGPRILPALPERIAIATSKLLKGMNVTLHCDDPVTEVQRDAVITKGGRHLPADMVVWAAGIKAPEWLRDLDGLETNRLNQLVVHDSLQTTRDEKIFALGDCAACPWPEKQSVIPPRAQSAHQQSSHLAKNLTRRLAGEPLLPFRYRDFGSLVSLGDISAVGNLMGGVFRGTFFMEGLLARLMYWATYQMHLIALHGYLKVGMDFLSQFLRQRTAPRVKLH